MATKVLFYSGFTGFFESVSGRLNMTAMVARETTERERRRRARIHVHWPLCFVPTGVAKTVETVTHNLSSDGFYCFTNTTFVPGEIRECTLGVPTRDPISGPKLLIVQCRVRVIRVETLGGNSRYGVGCHIEDYHLADRHI